MNIRPRTNLERKWSEGFQKKKKKSALNKDAHSVGTGAGLARFKTTVKN